MILGATAKLKSTELTRQEWESLFKQLTFIDNEDVEVRAFDNRPGAGEVVLPRGAVDMLPDHVELTVDKRSRPRMPKLQHTKPLDENGFEGQKDAVRVMFEREQGQMRLPTGSGKTTIGCAFVAACATRTLVLVHTKDLLKQWVDRAHEEIPGIDVGTIQGKKKHVGHLTVATMQTMRDSYLQAGYGFWSQFGCVIVDESQHTGSQSYEWILNACPAYYRFGLSASDKRSDGRQKLVRFNLGPVIYRMRFRSQVPIEVQPVFTNFRSRYNSTMWTRLVAALVRDEERNKLIAEVTEREVLAGHSVLTLSRQIPHLERIADHFTEAMAGQYMIVTGRVTQRMRDRAIDALRSGELRCILGNQIFEEGIDAPRISRVLLAFPGTDVTTLQKVGRATRKHESKVESLVYDFVDPHVAGLARQWAQRRAWYKNSGINVRTADDHRVQKKHVLSYR